MYPALGILENSCVRVLTLFNLIDNFIVRKAQHLLCPPESLLGAPADVDRYRAHIKQHKWFFFRKLVLMWWDANKPGAVNFSGKKTRPARMLLIPANSDIVLSPSRSEDYLKRQKENPEYDTTGIALLTDEEFVSLYEKYTLSWSFRRLETIMHFMLHFKGWVHCMESGEPVLIAEYGTAPPPFMPDVSFKHLAVLTSQGNLYHDGLAREQIFRFPHVVSPCCYAITPDGACRLVEAAGRLLLTSLQAFTARVFKRLHVVYYPVLLRQMEEEALRVIAEASPKPLQENFWRD